MTKFKFSIIVPVYNTENYISKTIDSVINQTIGFKNNVELILVDDGSTDKSGDICLKYKEKYPSNIVYIKQKNSGVSASRNNGIKYAHGEYVNFLDSDDLWEKHTLKNVYDFFTKHKNEIDVVACRVKFFEQLKSYHPLDYKFKESKIVDITKEYNFIQLNGPTTFVKLSSAKKYKFDERLKYGEDPYWINQIILNKAKYGVLKEGLYSYRKRNNTFSSTDNLSTDKNFFDNFASDYLKNIYEYTLKNNKKALKYIESLILYEIYWKISIPFPKDVLTDKEKQKYTKVLNELMSKISDEVILSSPTLPAVYKLYFLKKKNENNINKVSLDNKTGLSFNDITFNDKNLFNNITFTKFRINEDKLIVHGKLVPIFINIKPEYYIRDINTNEKYKAKLSEIENWCIYSTFNEMILKTYLFRIEIPIKNNLKLENIVKYNDKEIITNFTTNGENKLNDKLKDYFILDKYIVSKNRNNIIVSKKSVNNLLKARTNYLMSSVKTKNIAHPIKRMVRPIYNLYRKFGIKNIILFESNPDFTDNAKVLFDYMLEQHVNDKYELVWLVKNKDDFKDIKIKNVKFVNFFMKNSKRSKEATYYYKHAKIILDGNKYVKKAYPCQIRIHLNHGSPFKDAAHYNLSIGDTDYVIVQSEFFAPVEARVRDMDIKKILPYGFPRNDVLYSKEKKKFDLIDNLNANKTIFWLPTYRNHVMVAKNSSSLKYGLACIEDEKDLIKLNDKLVKENVYLIIKFHPVENTDAIEKCNLSNILIIKNDDITSKGLNLYDVFNKVDALITDYSSVYFDFCLTKKNIGLAISDFDEYLASQGEFQYKYEDAIKGNYMYNIDDLITFVDDVSKGKDRSYKERMEVIKKYDDYQDGKSVERIYELIKKYL